MSSKYLDLNGLSIYDALIKQYIQTSSGGTQLYLHTIITTNDEPVYIISTQSSAFTRTSSYLQVTGKIINCLGYSDKNGQYYFCYPVLLNTSTSTNLYIDHMEIFETGSWLNMADAQSDTITAL